jgi:hypothetical protein
MHPVIRTILQGGDGITYLYNAGDEYTTLTGGWAVGYSGGTGTQSKQADHLALYASGANGHRQYDTANLIDLTNFNTVALEIEVTQTSGTGAGFYYGVGTTVGGRVVDDEVKSYVFDGLVKTHNVSLDVSAVNGLRYVRVSVTCGTGSSATLKVKKVLLT